MLEQATRKVGAELTLDETGHEVIALSCPREQRLELFSDDGMEDALLGPASCVGGGAKSRGRPIGATSLGLAGTALRVARGSIRGGPPVPFDARSSAAASGPSPGEDPQRAIRSNTCVITQRRTGTSSALTKPVTVEVSHGQVESRDSASRSALLVSDPQVDPTQRQDEARDCDRNHGDQHCAEPRAAEREVRPDRSDVVHRQENARTGTGHQPREGRERLRPEENDLPDEVVDALDHPKLINGLKHSDGGDGEHEHRDGTELKQRAFARRRELLDDRIQGERPERRPGRPGALRDPRRGNLRRMTRVTGAAGPIS